MPPTTMTYDAALPLALLIRRPPPVCDRPGTAAAHETHSQGYPPGVKPGKKVGFTCKTHLSASLATPARRQSSAVHACRSVIDCYILVPQFRSRRSVTPAPPKNDLSMGVRLGVRSAKAMYAPAPAAGLSRTTVLKWECPNDEASHCAERCRGRRALVSGCIRSWKAGLHMLIPYAYARHDTVQVLVPPVGFLADLSRFFPSKVPSLTLMPPFPPPSPPVPRVCHARP